MLFFFKEKPLVITAFLPDTFEYINQYSSIKPASKFIPTWWKQCPKSSFNWENHHVNSTVRSCPGFLNNFSLSYLIPLWTDIAISNTNETSKITVADRTTRYSIHSNSQSPSWYDNFIKIKIDSPWVIESKVNMFLSAPSMFYKEPFPFIIPGGILSPISNLMATNIFTMFKIKNDNIRRDYLLKLNSPILQLTPMTERRTILKTEVITNTEYFKKLSLKGSITNSFIDKGLKLMRIKKNT